MITITQFQSFEQLYNYYNAELFAGKLPECMINMSRKKNSHGFFAPARWSDSKGNIVHEISLNPDSLAREDIRWHSTLVHEMCHLWEEVNGFASKYAYHTIRWADKMEEIGLMPSSTGQPGGKRTGQRMTHYILDGGMFKESFDNLAAGASDKIKTPYAPRVRPEVTMTIAGTKSKSGVKVKYTCECGNNVWGKENLFITCDECEKHFFRS